MVKKVLLVAIILILVGGVSAYAYFSHLEVSETPPALVPTDAPIIGDTVVEIGTTTLTVLIKRWEEEGAIYEFYTTDEEPKLLAKVESYVPFEPAMSPDSYREFFEKDITGDEIPEIFVLVEENAKALRAYEILQLEEGSLRNIVIKDQKDNPKWVEFFEIEYSDRHISMTWAGAINEMGKNFYKLEGNELYILKSVRLSAKENNWEELCDVSVKNSEDTDFTVVDSIACVGDVALDRYFYFDDNQLEFLKGMRSLADDPKWKELVSVYKENCELGGKGATFGGGTGVLPFTELVKRGEPEGKVEGVDRIVTVPCSQGAYQSAYLAVFYDEIAYTPLKLEKINEDGSRFKEYWAVEGGYNPETRTFSYMGAGNGMHTCWNSGEYKLVGKVLVLQKFEADWNCDDREMGGKVIYQL